MRIPDWLNPRKIPHPQYGNYGGAQTRCDNVENSWCPVPLDDLDEQFEMHDIDTTTGDPLNDVKLVGRLLTVNPLGHYDRPVYGRVYHAAALAVFIVMMPVTTPVRFIKKLLKGRNKDA